MTKAKDTDSTDSAAAEEPVAAQEPISARVPAPKAAADAIDAWYARHFNRAMREHRPTLPADDLAALKRDVVKAVSP